MRGWGSVDQRSMNASIPRSRATISRPSSTVRNRLRNLQLLVAVLVPILVFALPAAARAAGTPSISMTKSTSGSILFGNQSSVTLTATNPSGQPRGYNLSFRDVLPVGVSYVGGSGSGGGVAATPQVIANAPAAGQTTLIWSNLSDLSAASAFSVSYKVAHSTSVFNIGDTYVNNAGAYINTDPRYIPKFDATGLPISGATSYTGSATASASTTITAITIDQSEPSPEGELLKGLHDRQPDHRAVESTDSQPVRVRLAGQALCALFDFVRFPGGLGH